MKKRILNLLLALVTGLGISTLAGAAHPTDADVGDANSFGKVVRWIGLVQAGNVTLAEDCTPDPSNPLGPDDRCVQLNPDGAATFAFTDLGRITLPGSSTDDLICHWATPLITYSFNNPTGAPVLAQFTSRGTYRFESEVLQDPSLIDPTTGLPFNGGIDISLPTYRDFKTLAVNATQSNTIQATRACIAGIITKSSLMNTYGLTEAQAKKFFKAPITIRAGVSGNARRVSSGLIIIGTRFTGD